jgi:hypothetical protein
VPGILKDAHHPTFGYGEFDHKPVAFISVATGGENAFTSLLLTRTASSTEIGEGATMLIRFVRAKLNCKGVITDLATYDRI